MAISCVIDKINTKDKVSALLAVISSLLPRSFIHTQRSLTISAATFLSLSDVSSCSFTFICTRVYRAPSTENCAATIGLQPTLVFHP